MKEKRELITFSLPRAMRETLVRIYEAEKKHDEELTFSAFLRARLRRGLTSEKTERV
ncbi:MAG: hypothetical protein Q4D38_12025 [Planctomycetia bacterium]|nr:hypothetical protein [Planctomycetia bacterium]